MPNATETTLASVLRRSVAAIPAFRTSDASRTAPLRTDEACGSSSLFFILALGLPLSLYYLGLLEQSYNLLTNAGAFMKTQRLSGWEIAAFLCVYFSEFLVLLLDISCLARFTLRAERWTRPWLIEVASIFVLFISISVQFAVFGYFRDTFGLALMRVLGGGSIWTALTYVSSELSGRAPFIATALVAVLSAGIAVRKFQIRFQSEFSKLAWVRWFGSARGLLICNGVLVMTPILLACAAPNAHRALLRSLTHAVFTTPGIYLTDFDFDGYSLVSVPGDFAPFDAKRHPYAIDVPGNGIDEDGIGGDLPSIVWRRREPNWALNSNLNRKSVVLIVLESARADLASAMVDGRYVMPFFHSLPGRSFGMVSHGGHTVASITALLNGTLAPADKPTPILDVFRRLGYATAVISGQNEHFGGMDALCRMHNASFFIDSTGFSPDLRMYGSRSLVGLAMPHPVVNSAVERWLGGVPDGQPFFLYVDFQEMHFPYHYASAPTPVTGNPIPRSKISEANRDWLQKTYWNAARRADDGIAELFRVLEEKGRLSDTVVIITGDHGEQLFDRGMLGHGKDLSFEENTTLGKLVNVPADVPVSLLGENELNVLLYNVLQGDRVSRLPISDEVLCYTGETTDPLEIGVISERGIVKYNFRKDLWTKQIGFGSPEVAIPPVPHVIHMWESYRFMQSQAR